MAKKNRYSVDIVNNVSDIRTNAPIIQDEAKRKISILDTAKIPYQRATTNLDRNLHDQVTEVNDTLYAVRNAYDERIDVQGCRTDLFWRLSGISSTTQTSGSQAGSRGPDLYHFTCTKLGVTYPKAGMIGVNTLSGTAGAAGTAGLSTNTVTYYNGTSYENFNLEPDGDGDVLNGIGSGLDAYYLPDNLHGLKLYDEPYARDVLDTFRGVGVGTIGIGATLASENYMTILTPDDDIDIKVGQIVTPNISGYFATGSVTVTSVGTTTHNLAPFPFTGIAKTEPMEVPYITVDQLPVQAITAPIEFGSNDGEYVYMLFSQDPSTIDDALALEMDDSPYVNQTIEIMSYSQAGAGVSVYHTNSGIASGTRSWNKFYDGLLDPNVDPDELDEKKTISEPPISADKIYYRIGFPDKPINYPGGGDAEEGDTLSISATVLPAATLYDSLPSCDNTALNLAIAARDAAELALATDPNFELKILTSNEIKKRMNAEFNLRIWAYRQQFGRSKNDLDSFNNFDALVTNSPFKDIMDEGSFEDFA